MPTPWRRELYKKINTLNLRGDVLDLGGSRKSGYHELIKGSHTITVANMDKAIMDKMSGLDVRCDLEEAFSIADDSYDVVIAFNVLEHIFNYGQFLNEGQRILKNGGMIVIGVPFLINVHPSPHDYWRYTEEALQKMLFAAGFSNVNIKALGRGPFTAFVQLLSGSFDWTPVRVILEGIAAVLDSVLTIFIKKEKLQSRYPLGYFVIAKK